MKHILFTILCSLFTLLLGCGKAGPTVVPISGTLTLKGQPLADCKMEFRKADTGAASYAMTDASGHFTLTHTHGDKGAEPGKYKVSVWKAGKPITPPAGKKLEDLPEEQRNQTEPDTPITNSDKSPIEVEITGKNDNLTIDVK